jgi:phosphopentomutase
VPLARLYEWCEIAYGLAVEDMGVGRVIARPFVGRAGAFARTANRHDYAMPPTSETLLDKLTAARVPVIAIGKIKDLFAGRGIAEAYSTASDEDGMQRIEDQMGVRDRGLIFANLVDFDTVYGHRNDVAGYAANLERFDAHLASLLPRLRPSDLLVITADHGNDPTTPSTDHSREHVPVLVAGERVTNDLDLGLRGSFADVGQTLAEMFGVGPLANGRSFFNKLVGGQQVG